MQKCSEAMVAQICALRDQGLTYAEIAKRMGTCHQTAQLVVSRVQKRRDRKERAQQSIVSLPAAKMPLEEFLIANDASSRLINIMYGNRYETVGDVLKETEHRLMRLPHMGKVSAQELISILKKNGLEIQKPSVADYSRVKSMPLLTFLQCSKASTQLLYALAQYHTVGDLLRATECDLLWLPGMGKKRLGELRTLLQKHDLRLGG